MPSEPVDGEADGGQRVAQVEQPAAAPPNGPIGEPEATVAPGSAIPAAKCHQCGAELTFPDGTAFEDGIPACPSCHASLFVLLPNECPACGYFLKKAQGALPCASGLLCGKCHTPIHLKTLEDIQRKMAQASVLADDADAFRPPRSGGLRLAALIPTSLTALAAIGLTLYFAFRGQPAPPPFAPPIQSPQADDLALRNQLSQARSELDRLKGLEQAQGQSQQLSQQIARQEQVVQQSQALQVGYAQSPAYPQSSDNSASSDASNAGTGQAYFASADDAVTSSRATPKPPKSAAESYLDPGQEIKQPKKGN